MKNVKNWADSVINSVSSVILGKEEIVKKILTAILCRGHVLLEDVPGTGKTMLARSLAASFGGSFSRIQCTPDVLPADILGFSIYNPKTGEFRFHEGPLNRNIVLIDEINRATPRSQSALLEAMAEGQISIEGNKRTLPDLFFLIATENPVEFEGTFPLPEAQKDRFFMSLKMGYPDKIAEGEILEAQRRIGHPVDDVQPVTSSSEIIELQHNVLDVFVEPRIREYILSIIQKTREDGQVLLGISPRGSLALYKSAQAYAAIDGRDYVIPEDVRELVVPVLCKRLIVTTDQKMKGIRPEDVIQTIVEGLPVPVLEE